VQDADWLHAGIESGRLKATTCSDALIAAGVDPAHLYEDQASGNARIVPAC
jgi:hypothetical protein